MNKNLLSIALFVFGTTISFAQNQSLKEKLTTLGSKKTKQTTAKAIVFRPGYSANYWWNSTDSQWNLQDTSLYQYNSEGYETEELRTLNGVINGRTSKTYDAVDRLIENLSQYYDNVNSVFVNSNRNVIVFDAQGNESENRYENWNSGSSLWEINSGNKYIRTYDANNNIIEQISQNYNSSIPAFENNEKYVATFNASNEQISEESFIWNGTAWDNSSKGTYIYSAGVLTSLESQDWDGTAYINSSRYTNVMWVEWLGFDDSEILSYTVQEWDGTNWISVSRTSYTYDQYGGSVGLEEEYTNNIWSYTGRSSDIYDSYLNYLGYKSEVWTNNAWVTDYEDKTIYTYVDGNITQKISQYWDNTNSILVNNNRKDYGNYASYSNSVSIDELNKSIAVNIYPNPVISNGNIEINASDLSEKARFILSDLSGKEVLNMKATTQFSFDRANLKSGFYTFKVLDNSNLLKSGKIILE